MFKNGLKAGETDRQTERQKEREREREREKTICKGEDQCETEIES